MSGFVRLLLALVATSLAACPAMASSIPHGEGRVTAERVVTSFPAASCHDLAGPDAAVPGDSDETCPDRDVCGIAAINQLPELSLVTLLLGSPGIVALPAAEIWLDKAGSDGFATGPPPRSLGPGAPTPLILKQRFLI